MTRVRSAMCALVLALASLSACGPATTDARPGVEPAGRPGSVERIGVTHVVDGDTVVLAGGEHVRLIGIDTPERGVCGARQATEALRRLVEGRTVELVNPAGVQDEDRYDRLLRYVDREGIDAGLAQIEAGLATARYDSRDGYDEHPREERYRATDKRTAPVC